MSTANPLKPTRLGVQPASGAGRGVTRSPRVCSSGRRPPGAAKLPFDGVFVQGADGFTRGRWPVPSAPGAYYAMRFNPRDYFRGAARFAAEGRSPAYVSDAFRSKADAMYKIGISRA